MKNNTLIIIVISVITILGFLLLAYKLTSAPPVSVYPEINAIKPDDHLTWSPDKKNILIEYSDFQCPSCRSFHTLLKQIEPKNVTFVYRHFPLPQHQNAALAAYAAEAAGNQGKFFEMANLLFDKQDDWSKLADPKDYFVRLASQLGLDPTRFKSDMDSQTVKNKVYKDLASGNTASVNATPTFFLNGKKLDNISSFEEFKKLLLSL